MANLSSAVATVPMSTGVNPVAVGVGAFVILLLLLLAVLAFGAGREHS